MPVTLEGFVQCACDSGLLSADVVEEVRRSLPPEERPRTADDLADELVRRSLLTPYQAARLRAGDPHGLVLGEYVILDELGSGGMGEVFKAVHAPMDRVVAIKTLRAKTLDSPRGLQRFGREVKAAARLVHPNIVTAFDAGHDRGVHYLAMEFVEGTNLSLYVKEHGPLDVGQAVDYVAQAARGLGYAHRQGITHRDVKPANLMRTPDGGVKLLDLGLARLIQPTGSDEAAPSDLTHEGSLVGTVDYMAPEQGEDTRQADHRSDIYSLGCTLHYLLTGRSMYAGETRMKKLLAHREQPIPSLRGARPDVSRQIESVFQRMVAKRPADRYQSMDDLLRDLERCADGTDNLSETRSVADVRTPLGSRTGRPAAQPLAAETTVDSAGSTQSQVLRRSRRRTRRAVAAAAAAGVLLLGYVGFVAVPRLLEGDGDNAAGDNAAAGGAARPPGANGIVADANAAERADQHAAALWALGHGGEVGIVLAGGSQRHAIRDVADLPAGPARIESISLAGASVTDESLEQLAGLADLVELNLSATDVGDDGIRRIARLTSLEVLRLGYAPIGDDGLRSIAALPRLRILELNDAPNIGDAGLAHLAGHKRLASLMLSDCRVTDLGVGRLEGLESLVFLYLDATDITDEALRSVGRLVRLERLDLSNTQVSDAGLVHLGGLRALNSLRLANTTVGDAGLKPLYGLDQLALVDLTGTRTSDRGEANLRAALPGCEVQR